MLQSNDRRAFQPTRVLIALGVFTACVFAAALVHVLIGDWGRDIRPTAGFLALFILLSITWLAGWRRHRFVELLVALVVVEVLYVAAIGWFAYGGVPHADRFFFSWFVPGNVFIALPWLVGTGLGAWLSRRRSAV